MKTTTENYKLILKEKKEIREKIRNIASNSPQEELQRKNLLIEKNLYSLSEYNNIKTLHIYVSSFCCEVNTYPIIEKLLNKGGRVIVPVVDNKNHLLMHSELKSLDSLKRSKLNIWEPEEKHFVNPDNAGLIVVPGIAFDLKGNRIGFGKGFYDRFLVHIDAIKVALTYEFQIVENIPTTNNDIPVNIIITEKRIIRIDNYS